MLGIGVWNDTQTRAIHLGFAVLLAFIAFPMNDIPHLTWAIAILGAIAASYLWWDYRGVANWEPQFVLTIAGIGIVLF